jgi:RNA polymerase sigma factor (sigma-70 family)
MLNPQDHLKLVSYVVVRLPFYSPELYDDLFQTGVIGLIAACKKADGRESGKTWSVYAVKYIKGTIYRDRRSQIGRIENGVNRAKPHANATSMDVDGFQEIAAIQSDQAQLDDWQAIRAVWESQWEASELDRKIIQLVYFDGLMKKDAAKRLGIGAMTLTRHHRAALQAIKTAYLAATC